MTRWLTAIALGLLTTAATAVPVLQGPPPRAGTPSPAGRPARAC